MCIFIGCFVQVNLITMMMSAYDTNFRPYFCDWLKIQITSHNVTYKFK